MHGSESATNPSLPFFPSSSSPPLPRPMSPSPYTLLPSNAEEKPRLERAPSLTQRRTEPVHPASKRWAFVLAGGLGFIVLLLVGALYWAVPALGPGAMLGKACGNSEASAAAASGEIMTTPSGGEDAMAKEAKTGERVLPMFSTSVYPNGDTSSFVFTTRPIVRLAHLCGLVGFERGDLLT